MATVERVHRRYLTPAALAALALLLGTAVGGRLILSDDAPASPAGGSSHRGAGTERILHVVPAAMDGTLMPAPSTAVEPQRPYADWEINAMTARHPEP